MYIKKAVLIILTLLILSGCDTDSITHNSDNSKEGYIMITADEAKEIIDSNEDVIVLDVREQDEYDAGHIENAVLIPYTSIDEKAENMLPDKDKTILVYCRSGRRSKIAADSLVTLGYTDVRDLGGIIDWPYKIITE